MDGLSSTRGIAGKALRPEHGERTITVGQSGSDYARAVSHELRNPLTPILGHLDLLREELASGSPASIARVDVMEAQLERVLSTLREMAAVADDLTKLDARPLDLGALVLRAVTEARDHFSGGRVNITADIIAGPVAMVDKRLLETALRHLIENAVTFSAEGGEVVVGCAWWNDRAAITITDHGTGMTDDEQDRAFDLFYRAPSAISQGRAGFGIGLARARQIVEAHGGEIDLASSAAFGTEVTLLLPAI
ncbi:signal transduction histidine kinase [Microbacterium endophyticum]|uniref:Sensor-like histidine kinase SenX3 n=1 Tax=Microbacterium endophyticum TaxID=1526412 RepID=A0A7W4V418_9MICO|nr:HAMP domain-containing sensor histidine kinase [Microbacterium endophyticum]MBB2976425.1 signal transduction histidine kinase [Microbacterium endophyticum]NIK35871.1 signal transduction histidine kinase [Microbacterium endophyticum]